MRTPSFKYMLMVALALSMAVVAWGMFEAKPPVSLTILRVITNRVDNVTAALLGSRNYVSALIAATNNSKRSFTYWAEDSANSVRYDILHETPQGWEVVGISRCGIGLTKHTLLRLSGAYF